MSASGRPVLMGGACRQQAPSPALAVSFLSRFCGSVQRW